MLPIRYRHSTSRCLFLLLLLFISQSISILVLNIEKDRSAIIIYCFDTSLWAPDSGRSFVRFGSVQISSVDVLCLFFVGILSLIHISLNNGRFKEKIDAKCVCIWTFGVRCSVKWKFMISKNLEINNVIIKWINDYIQSVFLHFSGFLSSLGDVFLYDIFLYVFFIDSFHFESIMFSNAGCIVLSASISVDILFHFVVVIVAAYLLITHCNIHSHIMAQFDVSQKATWAHGHIINGNNFESTN